MEELHLLMLILRVYLAASPQPSCFLTKQKWDEGINHITVRRGIYSTQDRMKVSQQGIIN